MWKETVWYARCSHVAMDYEHQYQHTAAWCSLPSKLSVPPAFPFYTLSTSHVLLQNKASLWNEGWASDLGKQNFLATVIEKMWNWILISKNPPSSLGKGGVGGASRHLFREQTEHPNHKPWSRTSWPQLGQATQLGEPSLTGPQQQRRSPPKGPVSGDSAS